MFESKSIMSGSQLIVFSPKLIACQAKSILSKTKTVISEAYLIVCVTNTIVPAPLKGPRSDIENDR